MSEALENIIHFLIASFLYVTLIIIVTVVFAVQQIDIYESSVINSIQKDGGIRTENLHEKSVDMNGKPLITFKLKPTNGIADYGKKIDYTIEYKLLGFNWKDKHGTTTSLYAQ